MILTGPEIAKQVGKGSIEISPFNNEQVKPDSYNYRLGSTLCIQTDEGYKRIEIPESGYVLEPHQTYLGSTYESIGSREFCMSLIGRSSMGRLGLFLQVSADLGHTGSNHCWTLEIVACKKIRIYPLMVIGQVSFWKNKGEVQKTEIRYNKYSEPTPSFD